MRGTYFDQNIDNFLCNNVLIELTSSRYFVRYIAKGSSCDKVFENIFKNNKKQMCIKKLIVEQCIKCTKESSALTREI